MDSFKEKAILLALVQGNIDYNKYKGDNYCVKVTKIKYTQENAIEIDFLGNKGFRYVSRFGFFKYVSRFGFDRESNRETFEFEVFNFIDGNRGMMSLFIGNYLYFSIETPPIIYALIKHFNDYIYAVYGYKCKDVVNLICKKMLKILLKQILKLKFKKCQELWDEYTTKRNNEEETQEMVISFVKNVFSMLQFDKSFELSIENNDCEIKHEN